MPLQTDTTILLDAETETDDLLTTPWHVVVHDDPVNLMAYVTMVLRRVFGYPEEKAQTLMLEVHRLGESIVWTGHREKAEFYVAQLQGYQLLCTLRKAS